MAARLFPRGLAALGLVAFLNACASAPSTLPPPGPPLPPPPRPASPPASPDTPPSSPPPGPAEPTGEILPLAALPGWAREDHLAALRAYQAGCGAQKAPSGTCQRARLLTTTDAGEARLFLEQNFRAAPLPGSGTLTAYFSPVYQASAEPSAEFSAPVRPTPADLKPGVVYAPRDEIEARTPNDAIAWMRPEDLFFLQIQGSGTLVYPDGRRAKALFAAHNSRAFAGIANPMRQRGLLAANNTSGEAIRAWLAAHRGPEAAEIMNLNPRYVFFRLAPDDDRDPAGAAGVSLPAGHAIAVDPAFHQMGQFYWIDAAAPLLAGAFPTYQRAVMALDTGGAIKGAVRADLYTGRGDAAGQEAGRVRHELRMYRLIPVDDQVR
jgi:membrane-bound lytic murein transglycosylase A